VTEPTPGLPGWLPDPSGRHELRWFDGARFSDQVADAGVQSTDPAPGPPPTTGVLPPADVTGRPPSRLPLILAALGALVVVVVLVNVLQGEDGGFGESAGEVGDGTPGVHEVSVPAGSAAVVDVDPGDDLDAVVGFVVSEDDADRLLDLYEGSPFELLAADDSLRDALQVDPDDIDGLPEDPVVVLRVDREFEGDAERMLVPTTFDLDVAVVVAGFDGDEGEYGIRVERADLDVDEDADGQELFDAVLRSDDVPRGLRNDLEALAGGG